jgi:DNA-binding NarL/FixJ family response regulator
VERIRILVVDDFLAWRQHLSSILKQRPGIEIVAEAADGSEAVRKASELQPDLILLDISLPRLNGIEAARQIRALAPDSRILFISQHTSVDFVEAALDAGARGYLVKSSAGTELFAAIEAVNQDSYYLSRRVVDSTLSHRVAAHLPSDGPTLPPNQERRCSHEIGFYSDESVLLDSFTRFVAADLRRGGSVIFVAGESHRESLLLRLHANSVDVITAIGQGRYIQLDPADVLSTFMVNGMPDSDLFTKAVNKLIGSAAKAATTEYPYVSACGECASYLLAQGNAKAAIRLEQLWNNFAQTRGLRVFCGYPLVSFRRQEHDQVFQSIRTVHSAIHFH